MSLCNNTMPVNGCWPFDNPVLCCFLFKTAGIANPTGLAIIILDFTPLIFSCRYAEHFIATHPEAYFSTAGGTVAVGIYRFGEPYPVFKAEGFIGQCAYGTYINNVSDKFIIQCFGYAGADTR